MPAQSATDLGGQNAGVEQPSAAWEGRAAVLCRGPCEAHCGKKKEKKKRRRKKRGRKKKRKKEKENKKKSMRK